MNRLKVLAARRDSGRLPAQPALAEPESSPAAAE
jgi:hypothetical protein